MKNATTYHETKLKPLVKIIANLVKNNPKLADDPDYLMATIASNIPNFLDKMRCINCGASMAEYSDILDVNDALLLYSMARILKRRIAINIEFTEANKIRVSSEDIHHTQKCRTTKCSKLGLIAKAGGSQWSITRRGFEALKGMQVPKVRVTFRGRILERPEETTTLRQVFYDHTTKMEHKQRMKKSLKQDHRDGFQDYDVNEWVHVAGQHEGDMI